MTSCHCILMLFIKKPVQLNPLDAVLHVQNIAEKENINVEMFKLLQCCCYLATGVSKCHFNGAKGTFFGIKNTM